MPANDANDERQWALPAPVNFDEQRQYDHGQKQPSEQDTRISHAMEMIENEISNYQPKPKLPDYVEPRPDVPPVGALSAQALVQDFEQTAKHIESMATDLQDAAQRAASELTAICNDFAKLSESVNDVVAHVRETASMYRDEAKSVFVRIEDTTLRMKEVRELSVAMRDRLTLTATGAASTLPPINFKETPNDGDTVKS